MSSGEPLPHYAVDRVNYYDPKYAMAYQSGTLPADRNCNDGGNCWADFPHNITIRQSCDLPGDVEIVAEDLDPSYPSYDPTMGPLFRQNVRPLFSQSPPFHDYVSHCGSVSQGDVKMPFVGCGHGYCIPSLGPLPVCSMGRDCYRSLGPSKCHCMGNWDTTTDCRTCLPDWHGADCEIKFTPPSPPLRPHHHPLRRRPRICRRRPAPHLTLRSCHQPFWRTSPPSSRCKVLEHRTVTLSSFCLHQSMLARAR